jgi:hypothetical protein
MIDFHVSWSIVVFAKCLFSYLSLWGVSFIVDLNFCPLLFYLLVCPICICFFSQLVISLSCRFLPRSFTIQESTFISTQIIFTLIALIRSAIPPTISFDLTFIFTTALHTIVRLCRLFLQCMR